MSLYTEIASRQTIYKALSLNYFYQETMEKMCAFGDDRRKVSSKFVIRKYRILRKNLNVLSFRGKR